MLIISKGYLPNEILNASYNYSTHEINVLLTIISSYRGESPLVIPMNQLTAGFGESNSNNKYLKEAIIGIISKPLEYWSTDRNRCLIAAIVTSGKICLIRKTVTFTIDPDMAKIIEKAKSHYSRYEMNTILSLQSRYAKRLYLYCNAWKSSGLWTMKIDQLREKLMCVDKYSEFSDFKKRIIDPAFAEINEKSEYAIEITYLKNGNRVESIMATVVLKKEMVKEINNARNDLRNFGLVEWQIQNVMGIMPESEIETLLNNVKMNRHEIRNIGGYLVNVFSKQGVPMDKKLF